MKSIVLSNSVLRVSWLSLWLNRTLKTLPFVVDCVLLLLLIFFSNQLKIWPPSNIRAIDAVSCWTVIYSFCFQCAFHWSSWFKFWRAIKLNNVFLTTDWISQLRNKKHSAQRFLVSFLCYVIVMSLPYKTYIIMYSRSPSHAKQSQYLKEGKWIVAIKPYKRK